MRSQHRRSSPHRIECAQIVRASYDRIEKAHACTSCRVAIKVRRESRGKTVLELYLVRDRVKAAAARIRMIVIWDTSQPRDHGELFCTVDGKRCPFVADFTIRKFEQGDIRHGPYPNSRTLQNSGSESERILRGRSHA